ncbi:dihydroneopterin aldolase [Effusibacillus pohliae]|uniref:dihydroneopterin aldolase n=1 Tax=Effusibacillus pohliae TaxID=232270 RepID=UPI00036D853B|nr:dihydroneopterin aldolase [Effusibacillus pohliae]
MDKICLHAMEFYAYHGVLEEEAKLGQKFVVDLEVATDLRRAGETDNLDDTLSYVAIYDVVKQTVQAERYQLIEAVAETIAARLLRKFSRIESVRVKVTKVMPPIEGILAGASVEIERARN